MYITNEKMVRSFQPLRDGFMEGGELGLFFPHHLFLIMEKLKDRREDTAPHRLA